MAKIKPLAPNQTEYHKDDGTVVFISYETPVAALLPDNVAIRSATKYSVTTSRHINQWLGPIKAAEVDQSVLDALI